MRKEMIFHFLRAVPEAFGDGMFLFSFYNCKADPPLRSTKKKWGGALYYCPCDINYLPPWFLIISEFQLRISGTKIRAHLVWDLRLLSQLQNSEVELQKHVSKQVMAKVKHLPVYDPSSGWIKPQRACEARTPTSRQVAHISTLALTSPSSASGP